MEKDHPKRKIIFYMNVIGHPSEHIAPELVQEIRKYAGQAEKLIQLHPAQLAIIYEQKWFQLFVPQLYGGLGLSLPEALQLEEALAWTDGSTGWTVTLCGGANSFIGFFDPGIISLVFNNNSVCLAGSGKSSGTATMVKDGYEITGYWNYATGASHATAFTANCMIEENGIILKNENGDPILQAFLFLKDEVIIHKNWNSMGMIATGSHSFEVKKVKVNKNRAFRIESSHATLPDPIYQFPFLPFAETTLAVNSSGMAMRFLDLCDILFGQKINTAIQSLLKNAHKEMEQARTLFYKVGADSWEECLQNRPLTPAILESITEASRELALKARQVTDELYPHCGLKAADPDTEINRIWRDIHTASQHRLLNPTRINV